MEDILLFRKRSSLKDEGLDFITGCEVHSEVAKRNTSGRASASAILIRGLLACLEGYVIEVWTGMVGSEFQLDALVRSHSAPERISMCSVVEGFQYYIPHGAADTVTYHIGILAILQALLIPEATQDLVRSYHMLLRQFIKHGRSAEIKPNMLQTADELYYWLRYRETVPDMINDKMERIHIADSKDHYLVTERIPFDVRLLVDATRLNALILKRSPIRFTKPRKEKNHGPSIAEKGFVGEQLKTLQHALDHNEDVLLAGYTGTGKTMCVQQAAMARRTSLIVVEGKEGMIDLDFLGSYLPQPDGSRLWKDGPILRAMRLAHTEPVILFLDELNRFPRVQINILIGLMNRVSGDVCRQMGVEIEETGEFYITEVPMTAEVVHCPTTQLRFIAAGNFGKSFAVYDLDPALRRRFNTVIDFEFLTPKMETALVKREHPGLSDTIINALVKVTVETRRMLDNGELPGCVDTASLLNWAGKCERAAAASVIAVMECARRSWADQVCGRNHLGLINAGSFHALEDYLQAIGTLENSNTEIKLQELPFVEFVNGGI